METGKKMTFVELMNGYKVSIPTIQRDYVQGRNDKKVTDVRNGLISNIFDKLVDGKKCHLNFTVGVYSDDDTVFLLDGQQRITTLFLAHFYIAYMSNNLTRFIELIGYDDEKNKKFTYLTRTTTQRFLNDLVNEARKFDKTKSIEKNIKESNWYSTDYNDDISIKSAIVVLSTIEEKTKGKDFNDLFNRLFNDGKVTFFFLLSKNIEKPHDHYIKINSRGKDLTDFELFKSSYFEKMEEYEKKGKLSCDFVSKIKTNLDNKWFEFAWNTFYNDDARDKKTDEMLRSLIHILFVGIELTHLDKKEIQKADEMYDNLLYSFNYKEEYFVEYCNYFYYLMQLILTIKEESEDYYNYYIRPFFVNVTDGVTITTNQSKVFIIALAHYAQLKKDDYSDLEKIKYCIAFLRNIISNDSNIRNSIEEVYNRCSTVIKLNVNDFENYEANTSTKYQYFNKDLIDEEVKKISIINDSKSTIANIEDEIFKAEKNLPFFNGRILFLMESSKTPTGFSLEDFQKYVDKSKYFNSDNYQDVISYMMSKKDYKTEYSTNTSTQRIYTLGYNDTVHYNYHWRNIFNKNLDFKKYIKELLDSNQLPNEEICAQRSNYLGIHTDYDFRRLIIEYPDVLTEFMNVNGSKYGRFWIREEGSNDIYLMRNTKKAVYTHFLLIYLYKKIKNDNSMTENLEYNQNEEGSYKLSKIDLSYIEYNRHKVYYDFETESFCSNEEMTQQYKDVSGNAIQDIDTMIDWLKTN